IIAPGIRGNNRRLSQRRQKLLTLKASPIINKGSIKAIAWVAGSLSINKGTANTPNAPANADLEIPVSKTTEAINSIVVASILVVHRQLKPQGFYSRNRFNIHRLIRI